MKYLLVLLATLSLAACGGGGSSSESSAPVTAVYSGTQTIVFSAGGTADTSVIAFQMTVRSDGTVSITDSSSPALVANGSVSGSNFTASGSVTGTEAGVTCEINANYSGSISSGGVSGSIGGNAPCTGPGGSLTLGVSGTFTASLTSKALIDGGSVVKAALGIAQ